MSEAKFTPGKWHVQDHEHAPAAIVAIRENRHLEVGCVFFTDLPSGAANARLLAAAPEMFALVQRVADHFENTDAPMGIEARRLIAAVTGEGEKQP